MRGEDLVRASSIATVAAVLATLAGASFAVRTPGATDRAGAPAAAERVTPLARGLDRGPTIASIESDLGGPSPAAAPTPASTPTPAATPTPTPPKTAPPTPEPTAPPRTPAPTLRAAAAASPVLVGASTTAAELRMLALMNASRTGGGLLPLTMDPDVAAAARRHSAAEAAVRSVYHDGPDGTAASRNVPACGTGWYGENTGKVWNGNVDALHVEFMNEPWVPINHRTNVMDPSFRRVGVGAVQGPDALYMTMVFCR